MCTFSPNSTLRATFPIASYRFHLALPAVKLTQRPYAPAQPVAPLSPSCVTSVTLNFLEGSIKNLRAACYTLQQTLVLQDLLGFSQTPDINTVNAGFFCTEQLAFR